MKKAFKRCKEFLKCGVVLALVLMLLSTSVMAANSTYSKYRIYSANYLWHNTGSTNSKATTGANWFIKVDTIGFGVTQDQLASTLSGTLGMAHAPLLNNTQAGIPHWTKGETGVWNYWGWLTGFGGANVTYSLGVRLDSLITGVQAAYSTGSWNSN